MLCVLGYTTLLRKIRESQACRFPATCSNRLAQTGRSLSMAFGSCTPSGRWDLVLVHESENVITNLLEFSFHFRSPSNLGCKLSFLLSLDNLLDLNLHFMFFVLRLPSLQSTWFLQRSVIVCCSFCCLCVTPFFNSASVNSSTSFSSSISTWCSLAFLATFNSCSVAMRPCFSSSVQFLSSRHCSPHSSRPAVGTTLSVLLILPAVPFSLLLAVLFCHFS